MTTRPPWPSRRGDQARVAGWVQELSERHELTVVCLRPPRFPGATFPEGIRGREVLLPWRLDRIAWHGLRLPLQVAMHVQPQLLQVIEQEMADFRPDVAVIALSRLGWALPALQKLPVVVDLVDSLALNMQRRAAFQPQLGMFWRWEARRVGDWENDLARRSAAATVVSHRDAEALKGKGGLPPGKVSVVPFGIPIPSELPSRAPSPIVLLSGNLGYFPTRDGALWLARKVWPRVRRACPDAEWWLAGSRIPRSLRQLQRLPGVKILENPEDLSEVRRQAAIAVAPMRAGSGTPIKVLEAMAGGLPVVATPEAAAGLDDLQQGEIRIASDPDAFAQGLQELLKQPAAGDDQVKRAWAWIRRKHELRKVARRFERVLEDVVNA